MTLSDLLDHALAKPETEETLPFGPDVLVLKTGGKVFLLIPLDADPPRFNAKCDPDRALILREEHEAIVPGYHMNKKHWNTITMDGSIPNALIRELVDQSYALVRSTPGKKKIKS